MIQKLRIVALPTAEVRDLQAGSADANGMLPERQNSDGDGVPCRHCLEDVPAGDPYLVLAYRPFPALQPYAEVGPIFLHAGPCGRYDDTAGIPAMFLRRQRYLVRGYGTDDRIVYGTGDVIASGDLADAAGHILQRPDVAYLHVRSASNNCYQCRIELA